MVANGRGRKAVSADLQAAGLMRPKKPHKEGGVPLCERTGESRAGMGGTDQWFVAMDQRPAPAQGSSVFTRQVVQRIICLEGSSKMSSARPTAWHR